MERNFHQLKKKGRPRTKTLVDFLKNYSSHQELHQKAFRAGGISFSEFKACPNDYYAANTGAVVGMIYYADAMKFAKKNLVLIMDALNAFERECGLLDKPTDDQSQFYNWLAWFAWENMAGELINYLED